jgi:trigger factor
MASSVSASVTELPESRVRVEAEVEAAEVERRLNQAAKALGREMRIPGFRKGKVPPPVVLRRVGREAVLDEAVRGSLGSWYVEAIDAAGVAPVGDPQLDISELPSEGEPLRFAIEIGVRPTAQLGSYKDLEVGRREPDVPDERIDEEVEKLRERAAKLETVDRAAESGDYVVMDYVGSIDGEAFEGGEGRDQLLELGSGRLIPGFEEQLTGAREGEERTVEVTFPDDYGADQLAGKSASFAVTVSEVKAKVLPELDDDFAADSAGFDTLAELREDIASKVREQEDQAIAAEFREAVVDAAVAEATVEVPEGLIEARARELWERMVSTLQRQGISKETYLQISQKTEEETLAEAKPDAEQALKREAVIAAVVEAEGIEPSEAELVEALEHSAEHEKTTAQKLLGRLRDAGRLDGLREDLAARKAVDFLVEHAQPISVEKAQARGKLWTPGADEKAASGGGLWTPGS